MKCLCINASGPRKGQQCSYNAKAGSNFCGVHASCKNPMQPPADVVLLKIKRKAKVKIVSPVKAPPKPKPKTPSPPPKPKPKSPSPVVSPPKPVIKISKPNAARDKRAKAAQERAKRERQEKQKAQHIEKELDITTTGECDVCMDDAELHMMASCGHRACINCILKTWQMQQQQKLPLTCLTCDVLPTPAHIEHLTDDKLGAHQKTQVQIKQAREQGKLYYCPFKFHAVPCTGRGRPTTDPNTYICDTCGQSFCIKCKKAAHKLSCDKSKREIEQWIDRHGLVICPKCGQGVEKSSGCDIVKCRCKAIVCYKCGKIWVLDHVCKR